MSEAGRRVDESLSRVAFLALRLCVWPVLFAMAVGYATWVWRHPELGRLLDNNRVPFGQRMLATKWTAMCGGALAVVYAAAVLVARMRLGRWAVVGTVAKCNRAFAFLLATPFAVALRAERIESTDPIWTCLLCVLAASCCAVSFYALGRREERTLPRWARRSSEVLAVVAVAALAAGYAWWFSRLSITNHHALNSRTTDLGYYDNIFYQSIHGRPLGCTFIRGETHLSGHFDPILVLLSPLYLLYPRAELLLVLQSAWLALGAVPVYLLVRRQLRSAVAGVAMALVWCLYAPMHGANLYEFHSLTLIAPLAVWAMYFLEIGAFKRYWATLLLLLLCREDVPLIMCFVGVHALLVRRPGYARVGMATIVLSLGYFVLAKSVFMVSSDILNSGQGSYGFAYYFSDLIPSQKGFGELVMSLVTNPIYVVRYALTNPQKILFLLQLLVPLGALPLLAPRGRITLAFGLVLTLLANRKPVFTAHFQYSCWIFPFAFALVPAALTRLRESDAVQRVLGLDPRRLAGAWLGAAVVASLLMSYKFGAIVENTAFRGGFGRITRQLDDGERKRWRWVEEMTAKIPPGASVAATNRLGPHISNRAKAYFYDSRSLTHYVFADERELKGGLRTRHQERKQSGELSELGRNGAMALFQVFPKRPAPAAPDPTERAAPSGDGLFPRPPEEPDELLDPREPPVD